MLSFTSASTSELFELVRSVKFTRFETYSSPARHLEQANHEPPSPSTRQHMKTRPSQHLINLHRLRKPSIHSKIHSPSPSLKNMIHPSILHYHPLPHQHDPLPLRRPRLISRRYNSLVVHDALPRHSLILQVFQCLADLS